MLDRYSIFVNLSSCCDLLKIKKAIKKNDCLFLIIAQNYQKSIAKLQIKLKIYQNTCQIVNINHFMIFIYFIRFTKNVFFIKIKAFTI